MEKAIKSCPVITAYTIMITSYRIQPAVIYQKFHQTEWFSGILGYGLERYSSIEKRTIECFRYVECDTANIRTFSYEFGSIIRDIGSVFGSIMDTIVRMTVSGLANKKRLDIRDYREWLIDNLPEIHLTSFEMSIMRSNRYVMPFSMFNDPCSKKISWWVTYNALKHSDIDAYKLGNLGYAIFGLSALAGLICTMYEGNIARYVTIFHDFGYREPIDELKKQLFVYQKD